MTDGPEGVDVLQSARPAWRSSNRRVDPCIGSTRHRWRARCTELWAAGEAGDGAAPGSLCAVYVPSAFTGCLHF